jgi:hypothetical protein
MASATRATRSAYRRKDCNLKVDRIEADVEGLIVRRLCGGGRRRCLRGCVVAQAGQPLAWRRQTQREVTLHALISLEPYALQTGSWERLLIVVEMREAI